MTSFFIFICSQVHSHFCGQNTMPGENEAGYTLVYTEDKRVSLSASEDDSNPAAEGSAEQAPSQASPAAERKVEQATSEASTKRVKAEADRDNPKAKEKDNDADHMDQDDAADMEDSSHIPARIWWNVKAINQHHRSKV